MDSIDLAIEVLNEALAADPKAMQELFLKRVKVNTAELWDHPTIQVGTLPSIDPEAEDDGSIWLRPLGLINGLFGVDDRNWGFIAMDMAEDGLIDKFFRIGA